MHVTRVLVTEDPSRTYHMENLCFFVFQNSKSFGQKYGSQSCERATHQPPEKHRLEPNGQYDLIQGNLSGKWNFSLRNGGPLRILTPQKQKPGYFEDPKTTPAEYKFKPSHWRVQGFLKKIVAQKRVNKKSVQQKRKV